MEEPREGDCRVPLISSLFCLCVTTGGILLVIYVFVPSVSQPWFPITALIMIGLPWIFWFLTYIYTCIKGCCLGSRDDDQQISQRSYQSRNAVGRNASMSDQPAVNSSNDRGRQSQGGSGGDSSVSSSKECEMPLTLSVAS